MNHCAENLRKSTLLFFTIFLVSEEFRIRWRVSQLRRKFFLTILKKFISKPIVFKEKSGDKYILIVRRGEIISLFQNFLCNSPVKIVMEHSRFTAFFFGVEKKIWMRGGDFMIVRRNFSCLTVLENFREQPSYLSACFWYRRNSWLRGGGGRRV